MNTALKTELQKEKYQALSDEDCLINIPIEEEVLGRLQGSNKLDLVTMVLADDLQDSIQEKIDLELAKETPSEPYIKLAKAVKKALDPILLMSEQYWINLGHDDVIVMINNAELYGILTPTQVATMKTLATYTINSEFKNVTLQDVIDARYEPVAVEVTYPSETYIIKSGKQDFEFDFIINDGSTNNVFDVRLEVCEVSGEQRDPAKWFEVKKAIQPINQGAALQFKDVLPSTSERTKTYNRFYFTPRNPCDFSVSVKSV